MSDLFGRLKSGAEKVAFEADKMSRLSRAKGELDKIKNQLQVQYATLGEKFYNGRETGAVSGPEFDEICQAIASLNQEVEAKDAEVQRIDAETYGGQAPQPAQPSVFRQAQPQPTSDQPASVPTTPPAAVKTTKFCPNCGTELPQEIKFCTNCGSKV